MSRRLVAATVGVVVAAVMGAAPVASQTTVPAPPPPVPDCANTGLGAGCGSGTSTSGDGSGTATSGGGGPVVPVDYERYFDEDGTGVGASAGYEDDGCWGIRAVPEGQGTTYDEAVAAQNAQGENGVLWGNCEIEDTIDPAVLAQAYWYRSVRPPPPTPLQVDPGKALTGLPAYLEIGGDIPATESFATPVGTLTFTMTPRYVVSWGDGATTGTESQGGPYPNGDITHTYTDEGGVTITVQAFWRTSWTLAGAGGDLPELPVPTEGALDLPVEQRQAVIDPG